MTTTHLNTPTGARFSETQPVDRDGRADLVKTLGGEQSCCGSQTSCVRQKTCF